MARLVEFVKNLYQLRDQVAAGPMDEHTLDLFAGKVVRALDEREKKERKS